MRGSWPRRQRPSLSRPCRSWPGRSHTWWSSFRSCQKRREEWVSGASTWASLLVHLNDMTKEHVEGRPPFLAAGSVVPELACCSLVSPCCAGSAPALKSRQQLGDRGHGRVSSMCWPRVVRGFGGIGGCGFPTMPGGLGLAWGWLAPLRHCSAGRPPACRELPEAPCCRPAPWWSGTGGRLEGF